MKATRKSSGGTSFFNHTIRASVSDLRQILGLPVYDENDGEDKVNFEWVMETESGKVFTVYDWKEYRKLKETNIVEWHIGGNDASVTYEAKTEIESALSLKNTKNTSEGFVSVSGDITSQALKVAVKLFPTLTVNENTVYIDGNLLFHSTEPKCVESFIFGLINGKSLKS